MPKSDAKRSEFASLSLFFAIKRIRNANWTPCVEDILKFKNNEGYSSDEIKYRIIGKSDCCLARNETKSKREVILNDEGGDGKWRILSSLGLWEEIDNQPVFQCLNNV